MGVAGLIRLAVSAVMLIIVLALVDLDALARTLTTVPPAVFVLVVAGYTAGQALSALKWWLLARAGGVHTTPGAAIRAFFVGMFLNCFGLGTVGGDLARGLLIARGTARKSEAIASVLADRVLGLAVLATIGALAALIFGMGGLDPIYELILIGVAAVIAAAWIIGPLVVLKLVPRTHSLREKLERLAAVFPKRPGTLGVVVLLSALFHVNQILLHGFIAWGLGVDVPWRALFVAVPFVNILSTLPISWNGLGVRENAYFFFFVPAIFTAEQAVAVGAIWLLAVTLSAAIGGIVAAASGATGELKRLSSERTAPVGPAGQTESV